MLQLKNQTPFDSQISVMTDPQGKDVIVLAIKGTFNLLPDVSVADEQVPLVLADEHYGDPAVSSIRYASEMLLPKPGCDIILNGHAHAPRDKKVESIDVFVSVGDVSKTVRVFGDRLWIHGGMSAPQPFEKIPLTYENAYGGVHHFKPDKPMGSDSAVSVETNPMGKGFLGKRKAAEMIGQPLPNLEDPRFLIRMPYDNPEPAGFGYVSPDWYPRKQYAGTYDEKWMKTRAPFLPLDFDKRFLLCGANGLSMQRRTFLGGESVRLDNVCEDAASIQFKLSQCAFNTRVHMNDAWHDCPVALETILFEPDEKRFCMVWKAVFDCRKKPKSVNEISVDFAKPQLV